MPLSFTYLSDEIGKYFRVIPSCIAWDCHPSVKDLEQLGPLGFWVPADLMLKSVVSNKDFVHYLQVIVKAFFDNAIKGHCPFWYFWQEKGKEKYKPVTNRQIKNFGKFSENSKLSTKISCASRSAQVFPSFKEVKYRWMRHLIFRKVRHKYLFLVGRSFKMFRGPFAIF